MMSANFSPVGETMSLEATLDLIKNAALYEQRLNELKDQEAKAIEATNNLSKAKDLNNALSNAKRIEAQAQAALTEARSKAASVIAQAEETAGKIVLDAKNEVDRINVGLIQAQSDFQMYIANIKLSSEHLSALQEDVKQTSTLLKLKQQEAKVLTDDIKAKREQFEALLK